MKKYPGMYKTYFNLQNKELAKKLAEEYVNSPSSILINSSISGHSAFILYCDELLFELQSIRDLNLKIWNLTNKLPKVALDQFLKQAVIEEIHQTNEMENVHSTRKEIKDEMLVIQNGRKGKRFDGMIRKYQLLLRNQSIPLYTCQDVRTLYDNFILEEVIKEDPNDTPDGIYFRKDPVYVGKASSNIHEGVFPENALNMAMEQALSFLNNKDYDPLIRIAAFHHLFGYIHPFYNGNGRMDRFISSYYLSSERIHYLVSLRLSYVIKSHRSTYYSIFKSANDDRNYGDLTCFVIEFLHFIREACEQVMSYLTEKQAVIQHYYNIIHNMNLDEPAKNLLYILCQVSICENDSLSTPELLNITKLSRYLFDKHLKQIYKYVIRSDMGQTAFYRADLQKMDNISQ